MTPILALLVPSVACVVAATLWVRRTFLIAAVDGRSMEPVLQDGDRVCIRRMDGRRLRRGQVVLVEASTALLMSNAERRGSRGWARGEELSLASSESEGMVRLIKRIAAVAGEPVPEVLRDSPGIVQSATVPAGKLALLGDNLDFSEDSRHIGYVPERIVVGVALGVARSDENQ